MIVSHYADYLKEKTADLIIEDESGFASYRWINEGKSVYIVDIYIIPEYRRKGVAALFADRIAAEAKERGCTDMIGSVIPSNKGSSESLDVLRSYGMELVSSAQDVIYFRKVL